MEHPRPASLPLQAPSGRRAVACLVLVGILLSGLAAPAAAQETVVPKRNVRTGYAKVLSVEPVYQTLTASRMEQVCEGAVVQPEEERRGLARIVGAVKDALTRDEDAAGSAEPAPAPRAADCRMVKVEREFRRPIAYDVDYVYRGMKYRSRLPYDPGNRLRVQVSLTPYVPGSGPDAPAEGASDDVR